MKYLSIVLLFVTYFSNAQFVKERSIHASIGLGLSASTYDDGTQENAIGQGLFLKGEYILKNSKWFELRPYVAVIITGSDEEFIESRNVIESTNSNGALLGGKFRLTFPIPYVAPYLETGVGASVGEFETVYGSIRNRENFTYHIPFSIGLSIGKNRLVDLGFEYFFMPEVEQYAGAASLGVTFRLDNG